MARNTEMLRRTQAGIETPRGTAAVPTIRLRDIIRLMDSHEPLEFDENAGTYDGWYTHAQGPVSVAGTAEGPVSFEDLGYWALHGIDGETVGASDAHATDPAFTWPFIPNPDEDTLAASTMEMDAPDNVYRSTMVMVPQWTIRGEVGQPTWMWSASLIGRDKEPLPAGYTAGIGLHDREFVKFSGTKLFIDDEAGTIGTTQVLAKFISFSVTCAQNLSFKLFAEDEDKASTKVDRGVRQYTGQIRLEFEDDAEKAKYRTGASRKIRIEREGSEIHPASASPVLPATNKRARIDIPRAFWLTPSDDPRNQNLTLTYGFRGYVDTTDGYPAMLSLVNEIDSYLTTL